MNGQSHIDTKKEVGSSNCTVHVQNHMLTTFANCTKFLSRLNSLCWHKTVYLDKDIFV